MLILLAVCEHDDLLRLHTHHTRGMLQVNPPTWASAVRGDGNARNQTYSLGSNATALTALTYADALRAAANDTTPEQATGNSDSMASGSSTSEVNSNMSCDSTCSELMLRSSSSSRSSTSGYSQDSMHAKYVSWQPGNRNRRTSHQAVAGVLLLHRLRAYQCMLSYCLGLLSCMQTCSEFTSYRQTGTVHEHIQKLNAVWCRCISQGQGGSPSKDSLYYATAQGMLFAHDHAATGAACNFTAAAVTAEQQKPVEKAIALCVCRKRCGDSTVRRQLHTELHALDAAMNWVLVQTETYHVLLFGMTR